MDESRVAVVWRRDAVPIAPYGISLNAVHAYIPEPAPWISQAEAAALVGYTETTIRTAVLEGESKGATYRARFHPYPGRRLRGSRLSGHWPVGIARVRPRKRSALPDPT